MGFVGVAEVHVFARQLGGNGPVGILQPLDVTLFLHHGVRHRVDNLPGFVSFSVGVLHSAHHSLANVADVTLYGGIGNKFLHEGESDIGAPSLILGRGMTCGTCFPAIVYVIGGDGAHTKQGCILFLDVIADVEAIQHRIAVPAALPFPIQTVVNIQRTRQFLECVLRTLTCTTLQLVLGSQYPHIVSLPPYGIRPTGDHTLPVVILPLHRQVGGPYAAVPRIEHQLIAQPLSVLHILFLVHLRCLRLQHATTKDSEDQEQKNSFFHFSSKGINSEKVAICVIFSCSK